MTASGAARPMLGRLLIVLTALALTGCFVATPAPVPVPAPAPSEASAAPVASPNLWLIDGPYPLLDVHVSGGAEPSILVDHAGAFVWIGDTAGLHRSSNGGATWTNSPVPFAPGGFTDGWSLAQDADGVLYASTTQGELSGVARSKDFGATWDVTPSRFVTEAAPISDRPWLAARGHGEVALVTNADAAETCAYSTDGATTFLSRMPVAGNPNAGNVLFDSAGRVVFANDATIYRSGAKGCTTGHTAMNLPAHGSQIFVQLGIDAQDRIYTALPTPGSSAMTIVGYPYFTGAGMKSLVVSPPELVGNTYGAISVHGDEVAVAWYGTQTPGDYNAVGFSGSWNVFVARVQGFWNATPTITYARLTLTPNHVGDFCFDGIGCTSGDRDLLDYFGIAHDAQGNLHVAYGDDYTGYGVRYAKLAALS